MTHLSLAALADYRLRAQQQLDPAIWHYLADGDSADTPTDWAAVPLMPRPLRPLGHGHTRLRLFGEDWEHPLLLAPVAYQRLFHADGEAAGAVAAAAQGGQSIISSLASQPFADIVAAAAQGGGRAPWLQLYWQGDRAATLRLLRRAEAAGCTVTVFTVDAPIKRATLQLPALISAVNLDPAQHGVPNRVFPGWMAQAPTWDDLRWLRQQVRGTLLVKGILHPDDAEQVLAAGADGLVVSNHGGRVLPGAISSLQALPLVAQRIAGRLPILVDSGIRSGRDVYVALAAGAAAVLIGRPYIWGLAAQGALGVAQVIRILRDELEMTMALTGCANLADIRPR